MLSIKELSNGGRVPKMKLRVDEKISDKVYKVSNIDQESIVMRFFSLSACERLLVGKWYWFKSLSKVSDEEVLFKFSHFEPVKDESSISASSSSFSQKKIEYCSFNDLITDGGKEFEKTIQAKVFIFELPSYY